MQYTLYSALTNGLKGTSVELIQCSISLAGYHTCKSPVFLFSPMGTWTFHILLICVQNSRIPGTYMLLLPEKNLEQLPPWKRSVSYFGSKQSFKQYYNLPIYHGCHSYTTYCHIPSGCVYIYK